MRIETVTIGDALVIRCPQCDEVGSRDDEGKLCAVTDIRPYAGAERRVRCAACGWTAKVAIAQNGRVRKL